MSAIRMVSNGIISIHRFLLYVVWHVFACRCPWHIAADVEVSAEVVHLSIEGGGAPFSIDSPLYNRKLQVVAIKDKLAAKRLSLVCINGSIPTTDEKGYTVQTYEPGSTVNIIAEPRACVWARGLACWGRGPVPARAQRHWHCTQRNSLWGLVAPVFA
jgi:hypothetical protein